MNDEKIPNGDQEQIDISEEDNQKRMALMKLLGLIIMPTEYQELTTNPDYGKYNAYQQIIWIANYRYEMLRDMLEELREQQDKFKKIESALYNKE
jgi:hypothetical protein